MQNPRRPESKGQTIPNVIYLLVSARPGPSAAEGEHHLQGLRQGAVYRREDRRRKVMVVQELLQMQSLQQATHVISLIARFIGHVNSLITH